MTSVFKNSFSKKGFTAAVLFLTGFIVYSCSPANNTKPNNHAKFTGSYSGTFQVDSSSSSQKDSLNFIIDQDGNVTATLIKPDTTIDASGLVTFQSKSPKVHFTNEDSTFNFSGELTDTGNLIEGSGKIYSFCPPCVYAKPINCKIACGERKGTWKVNARAYSK